jgi:succinoglycan biosynthesis transport protein ExoP
MDLINFLRVLARRIWLILGITALAMVATWLITRGNPDMYKSTALISTGITDRIELDKQAEWVQWEKIENDFNNLIEAMNSRQAISLLSYRLIQHDLRQQEAFPTSPR